MQWPRFRLNRASRIVAGERGSLAPLFNAIVAERSIFASQSSANCLTSQEEAKQWLYCDTSGSTGKAKTIQRSPQSWIKSFERNGDLFALSLTDCYALLGHIGHSLTLYAVLEACHHGADVAMLQALGPKAQRTALAEHKISVLYATPTQLRLLAHSTKVGKTAKSIEQSPIFCLRLLMIGGGKLDATLLEAVKQLFPNAQICEFYGASETSFLTLSDETCPIGSVGKAYPMVTLQIRAITPPYAPLPPFQTGEIWVSSPYLFEGYAKGETADTIWQGKFLSIGELGYLDEAGHLFLKGRKSRMATVADQNVFLQDIEQLLLSDARVEECAALAMPDALRGARIIAIIGAHNHPTLLDDLRQICRQKLNPPAMPKDFIRCDHLPKLPSGKMNLQALQSWIETQE